MAKTLKTIPRDTGINKRHFSNTTKCRGDKEFYIQRNKKYTENSKGIEVRSESPVNTNLTSQELKSLL